MLETKAKGPACIIFDLDGTLVDSEVLSAKAFCDLIPALGWEVEEILAAYRGWKLSEIIGDIEERHGTRLGADFVPVYRRHVEALFQEGLKAFPGVHEALASIKVRMCVASSGPKAKIESALLKTGLAHFFGSNVFSSYDVGCWKPDPGLFLFAAKAMAAKPEDCLVVEDSQVGIEAAQAAGMRFLRFTSGSTAKTFEAAMFESYSQLAAKVDGLFS